MNACWQTVMSVEANTPAYRRTIRHRTAKPLPLLAFATIERHPRQGRDREKM